jgi:predicted dehydrogenase
MTVAIIGPGMIGASHAAAWREVGAEVSYLVSRHPDATLKDAPNARTVTDLEVALMDPDVDIVTVCTPTPTHRTFAEAALRAGKHVLLEKPMALTVPDAQAIAREAEVSGRVLMVGHVVRFFDAYVRVRRVVQDGGIGRPVHVRAERMIAPPATPWWFDEEQSGGPAVDLGIHDLDQANLLLGRLVGVRSASLDPLGPVETTVRYEDGGLAQVLSHARMPAPVSFATSLQVTGDAGIVATRFVGGEHPVDEFTFRGEEGVAEGGPGGAAAASDPGYSTPYAAQAAHFLECVASGRASTIAPVADAVLALRTALAARDSLRAGGAWMPVD